MLIKLINKLDNSFLNFSKILYCWILYLVLFNSLILIISDLLYKKRQGNFLFKLSVFSNEVKSSKNSLLNKNCKKYFPVFIYNSIFLLFFSSGCGVEDIFNKDGNISSDIFISVSYLSIKELLSLIILMLHFYLIKTLI